MLPQPTQTSRRVALRRRLALTAAAAGALLLAALAAGGCDALTLTPEGLVKFRIQEHARAISDKKWQKALGFYDDSSFVWQTPTQRKQGRGVAAEFLDSIRTINACDSFYTDLRSVKRINETRIMATVTMQAHVIESSMTLSYSNVFWDAKMLWVRRGATNWLIAGVQELQPRQRGKYSRFGL